MEKTEAVSFEEVLISNTIEQEALVSLLVKKGIISHKELLDEIRRISKG
jgi:hypothetical protein